LIPYTPHMCTNLLHPAAPEFPMSTAPCLANSLVHNSWPASPTPVCPAFDLLHGHNSQLQDLLHRHSCAARRIHHQSQQICFADNLVHYAGSPSPVILPSKQDHHRHSQIYITDAALYWTHRNQSTLGVIDAACKDAVYAHTTPWPR
jgi:hypothetical protein